MTDPTPPGDEPVEPTQPVEPTGVPGSESWTDEPAISIPPLPQAPPAPHGAPGPRYDTKVVIWTTVITTVLAGILSVVIVLVPIMLIVAVFLTAKAKDVRTRSTWMGILIGCALGLLIFAGVCVAILNSSGPV